VFWLTAAGAHQVELVRVGMMDWLTQRLVQSSGLRAHPEQVGKAMERITQNVLVQRDWSDDETQAIRMRPPRRAPQPPRGGPQPPRAAPAPVPPRPAAPDPRGRTRPPGPTEPPTTRFRPPGPPRGNPRPPHR
jgi:hypothetical protein